MDNLSKEHRRKNMQAIRGCNTIIENTLARALWSNGLRYRRNYRRIKGTPDIALVSLRIAIFCDSEFWHGKDWSRAKQNIKSNKAFWHKKIENNIERDKRVNRYLRKNGWIVLRFWGDTISRRTDVCVSKVLAVIKRRKGSNI